MHVRYQSQGQKEKGLKIQKICVRVGGEVRNVKSGLPLTLTLSLTNLNSNS